MRTTAIRDGDHYVVNGTKRFITNANRAGMFTLMARTDPTKKGAARHFGVHRSGEHAGPLASASPKRRWASRARISAT